MTSYNPIWRFTIVGLLLVSISGASFAQETNESDTPSFIDQIQSKINAGAGFIVDQVLYPVLFYGIPIGVDETERFRGLVYESSQGNIATGDATLAIGGNGSYQSVDVSIKDGQSLNEVAEAINAHSVQTGIRVAASDTDLIFSRLDGGVPIGDSVQASSGNFPVSTEQRTLPQTIPLVLLVLVFGGIFFTVRFGFANIRLFRHCIEVIRGNFDKEDDEGEVSHFQALTSALSATVGLGNIASVAVAISVGGAGAVFWMWCVAFFGMSSKFSSCTLAQLYRRIKPDGSVLGGPMVYLQDGIKERFPTLAPLGRVLAVVYAVFAVLGAFGGGNMFQGNQTFSMFRRQFNLPDDSALIVGLILGAMVAVVIIGGIRRIGQVTSKLVPLMCATYCAVCLLIIIINIGSIPTVFVSIFNDAFSPQAIYGGMIGVLIQGARRAAFSNEAGMGSAAIAHAAAKTDEPVREGIVALIGPFIDTILVCSMTALAILVTNSHMDPMTGEPMAASMANARGVEVTASAFASLGPALPYFLCLAVFVFAYSTMISWSYYGERAIEFLFGQRGILPYRIVYVAFVVLGPVLSLQSVLDFSDMMLLSLAFPNIIGMVLLSGLVGSKLKDYVGRLKSGEMVPNK